MMRPFGQTELFFIIAALRWTVALSVGALVIGGIAGMLVAVARVQPGRLLRWVTIGFIELFQDTPLLLQLFVAFFGLGIIGINVDAWTAAMIALSLHTAAFLGEIWRGSLEAIPGTQWEAARALSLSWMQTLRLVIMPQAVRISVAPTVGFLVQLIKGTSVTALIGYLEVTRAGQLVSNVTLQPFAVYSVVAGLYVLLCWPLSFASQRLEARLAVSTRRTDPRAA
ncbi:MAG: amino acid ABC transporter permease [Alphaproteobacteria bacterium]|nr:amino acid ABC transporter permease [Alphaproteobacteria bacterium]